MQNHDAVVSTLGPRKVFKPSSMLYDSALATTRAMNRAGVKRLVVLSAAAHFPGVLNRIASFNAKPHARFTCDGGDRASQRSGLDDCPTSTPHSRGLHHLPNPGKRRSQD